VRLERYGLAQRSGELPFAGHARGELFGPLQPSCPHPAVPEAELGKKTEEPKPTGPTTGRHDDAIDAEAHKRAPPHLLNGIAADKAREQVRNGAVALASASATVVVTASTLSPRSAIGSS
jgi:hypothetical protein